MGRGHGSIGIVADTYFYFAYGVKGPKGDTSSICVGDTLSQYLSRGWPEHLRRESDQVADLKSTLAEIGKMLSEHPDFQRGNSKIHYCAHKALGAAQ